MKLKDLEAKFIIFQELTADGIRYHEWDGDPEKGVNGLVFDCPTCFTKSFQRFNPAKRHRIICWSVEVSAKIPPAGRWAMAGSMDKLTLDAPAPAIVIGPPCNSSFLIKDGELSIL